MNLITPKSLRRYSGILAYRHRLAVAVSASNLQVMYSLLEARYGGHALFDQLHLLKARQADYLDRDRS